MVAQKKTTVYISIKIDFKIEQLAMDMLDSKMVVNDEENHCRPEDQD